MRTGAIRVDEVAAARLLLMRAVETEDGAQALLTDEDRRLASAAAVAAMHGAGESEAGRKAFLEWRAGFVAERLGQRYPALPRMLERLRWPTWVSLGLPSLAPILGASTDAVAGERLNILAFPLLGLLAWNLLAYLLLTLRWLGRRTSRGPERQGTVERLLARLVQPASARLAAQPTLERAVARMTGDWASATAPLHRARVRRTLHLSAALFAVGMVAAMLLRARYMTEYQAGWAGTWAGAEAEVAALLGVVLGPASVLTGIALPDAQSLRQLQGQAENAGDWLILWAVTAALFVIVPRLILAAASAGQAAVLKQRLSIAEDFYFRSLVRSALGKAGAARVVPYAFEPDDRSRERLRELLGTVLGEKVTVSIDPPVPYGEEETWLATHGGSLLSADHLILLFSLSSTPEAENHGAFARGVAAAVAGRPTSLHLLLEEGAMRRRAGERRLAERMIAWRTVLSEAGAEPIAIDLTEGRDGDEAQRLEGRLLRTPVGAGG